MGRPRTGSVRQRTRRGGVTVYDASVPRPDDPSKRIERTFGSRDDADRWIATQLSGGATTPTRRPRPGRRGADANAVAVAPGAPAHSDGPSFGQLAHAWLHERYVELEAADAERESALKRNLETLLIPAFDDVVGCDILEGRARVVAWVRAMSGRTPSTHTERYTPAAPPYARKTGSSDFSGV